MSASPKASSLRDKLLKNEERYSLIGTKPTDLPTDRIIERVADFMIADKESDLDFAFGNSIEKSDAPKGTKFFDPIEEFRSNPEKLEQIQRYVELDLIGREHELLSEAETHESSYNCLRFGAAMKIARNEKLSDSLAELVVKDLLGQRPEFKKPRGRPKRDPHADLLKYRAIVFAVKHGTSPTRNEASSKTSACDIVESAALRLRQAGHDAFRTGFGYDNLKKIYLAESKKNPTV